MTTESLSLHRTVDDGRETKSVTRTTRTGNGAQQLSGTLWFIGWLFTIGFCKLVWWKALLAVCLWPYFLGASFH